MKIFESKLYGKINEPESLGELFKLITELMNKSSDSVYMWRGQGDIDWRIDHTAYRRLSLSKTNISESDICLYESSLMMQATHKGYRYQEGRVLGDFELLTLLQHHGAATRLLDFSKNILIALWFAVTCQENKTALLFGYNTENLGGWEDINTIYSDYSNHIEDVAGGLNLAVTYDPYIVTPRVAAQYSQFIYSGLSKSKKGSLVIDDSTAENVLIAISSNLKMETEKILNRIFGIRNQTLFPDIDGFGKSNTHKTLQNNMHRW